MKKTVAKNKKSKPKKKPGVRPAPFGGMKLEDVIKTLLNEPSPSRGYRVYDFKKGKILKSGIRKAEFGNKKGN